MPKNVYVIHDADLDGYAASHVIHQIASLDGYIDFVEFVAHSDRSKLPDLDYTDKLVYILDLTYSTEIIQDLLTKAKNVIIFDHHKSTLKEDIPNLEGVISTHRCTAMLVYNYFHAYHEDPPSVIKYVDDYDRWVHAYPESMALNEFMLTLDKLSDRELWNKLFINDTILKNVLYDGQVLLKASEVKLRKRLSRKNTYKFVTYKGKPAIAYSCNETTQFSNNLASELLTMHNVDVIIRYYIVNDGGDIQVSFRSNKNSDTDVSVWAAEMGGGGHKNAAGARVEFSKGIEFLKELYQ